MSSTQQELEFHPNSYVELRTYQVPHGWSNHPGQLGANTRFHVETGEVKAMLHNDFAIPDARPILTDGKSLYLLKGGNGRYYLWNDISDFVARLDETSLDKILDGLKKGPISSLGHSLLRGEQTTEEEPAAEAA